MRKKETVPDWSKFFGSVKIGDIVGPINQKLWGFVALGAHAGLIERMPILRL